MNIDNATTGCYTSLDIAGQLQMAGLNPDAADVYISYSPNNNLEHSIVIGHPTSEYDIPLWSVTALLAILPNNVRLCKTYDGKYSAELPRIYLTQSYKKAADALGILTRYCLEHDYISSLNND